jgi:hypothetical protein
MMKKSIVRQAQVEEALLDLGKVLGQSVAFGTIAGRCSAAQAAALGQARAEKAHRRFGMTWKEFCPKHLRMSGTQADEIIRLLREFGPEYFENTETVRISPDTYRLVAPLIREKTLHVEGETLELNCANVQRVARRMRESQRALPAPAEATTAPAAAPVPAAAPEAAEPAAVLGLSDRINALYRHSMGIAAEFREVAKDCRMPDQSPNFHAMLRSTITLACCELKRVSLENGVL